MPPIYSGNFDAGKKHKALQAAKREVCASFYEKMAEAVEGELKSAGEFAVHELLTHDQHKSIAADVIGFLRTHAARMKKEY